MTGDRPRGTRWLAKFSPDRDVIAYHAGMDAGYTEVRVLDLESGEWSAYSCESWSPKH